MKSSLFLSLIALTLLAGPSRADVTILKLLPPSQPRTAQTVTGWQDTVALLRDQPGFRSASLHEAKGQHFLVLIRWDTEQRLDRVLSVLGADPQSIFAAIRYDLVAESRRWPGPPWMPGSRGWGQ